MLNAHTDPELFSPRQVLNYDPCFEPRAGSVLQNPNWNVRTGRLLLGLDPPGQGLAQTSTIYYPSIIMLTGLWSPVILVRAMRERAGNVVNVIRLDVIVEVAGSRQVRVTLLAGKATSKR